MLWITLLFSCSSQSSDQNLIQNIAKGLAECKEDKINLLAQTHNIQTAFEYCGENQFNIFRWSFDGKKLFFGYYGNSYIQNGELLAISAINIPKISSVKPAWLENGFIAIPLSITKDAIEQKILWYLPDGTHKEQLLSLTDIDDVQNYTQDTILFTAINKEKKRMAYTLTYGETEPKAIFSFLTEPFEHINYAAQTKILGVTYKDTAHVYREETLLFTAQNASRAIPHPFADFVALESKGEPKSILQPIDTVGKTPEEIEREQRKQKHVEDNLPAWMDKTYIPNEIHMIDLTSLERYRISFIYGENFEWYTDNDYYCSLTLQGIGGESIHPNVGLLTLRHTLGSIRLKKPEKAEKIGIVGP